MNFQSFNDGLHKGKAGVPYEECLHTDPGHLPAVAILHTRPGAQTQDLPWEHLLYV